MCSWGRAQTINHDEAALLYSPRHWKKKARMHPVMRCLVFLICFRPPLDDRARFTRGPYSPIIACYSIRIWWSGGTVESHVMACGCLAIIGPLFMTPSQLLSLPRALDFGPQNGSLRWRSARLRTASRNGDSLSRGSASGFRISECQIRGSIIAVCNMNI